jgi:hypothetical protein
MSTTKEWLKTFGVILVLLPAFFPLLVARALNDNKKVPWQVWCVQFIYSSACIYGILDWLNGWTPDPVIEPITYTEPSELQCDPRFIPTGNGC